MQVWIGCAKKQIEGKHAKRLASKRCQTGASKHVIKQKMGCPRSTNVGLDWVCIVPGDWNMDNI